MNIRPLGLLVALLIALSAVPAGAKPLSATSDPDGAVIGGTYGRGAAGPGSYAVLIDVHSIRGYRGKPAARSNCANEGSTSASEYAYTGWKLAGDVPVLLNAATVPSQLGDVLDEMQASWNAWKVEGAVPGVSVANGSTVTKYTANQVDDLLFGRTGSSLATTYTWRWNDGTVESDTVFNKSIAWTNLPSFGDGCYENVGAVYDVRNIATHEFGHSYGLDHPDGRFETMYAYGFSGETVKWTLGAGDTAGIKALY
jgi:hypothetical protein